MATQDFSKYTSIFSESAFWGKIGKILKKAGEKVVYLALLLFYMVDSDQVDRKAKLTVLGALGYLILPIDLIPDSIPMLGFTDDFAAMWAAYEVVKNNITPDIKAKAQAKCDEWFGPNPNRHAEMEAEGQAADGESIVDEQ